MQRFGWQGQRRCRAGPAASRPMPQPSTAPRPAPGACNIISTGLGRSSRRSATAGVVNAAAKCCRGRSASPVPLPRPLRAPRSGTCAWKELSIGLACGRPVCALAHAASAMAAHCISLPCWVLVTPVTHRIPLQVELAKASAHAPRGVVVSPKGTKKNLLLLTRRTCCQEHHHQSIQIRQYHLARTQKL